MIWRKKGHKRSIRYAFWQYFVGFALLILAILWLLQTVFLNSFYKALKTREIERIGEQVFQEYGTEDFGLSVLVTAFTKGVSIQLVNGKGWSVNPSDLSADVLEYQPAFTPAERRAYFGGLEKPGEYKVFTGKFLNSGNMRLLYTAFLGEEDNMPIYLVISTPLEPVESAVDVLQNMLVIVSVLALALALILSYFISRRMAKPLVNMSIAARQLAKGNMDVEFAQDSYAEIDDLALTLNRATDEIGKTLEMRKDLIANVSHDLKTPLTVIKSYGEMIRDISGDDKKLRNRHIDTIIQEADTLTHLVNDLLDLSRVESEIEDLRQDPVNLVSLIEGVLQRFSLLQEEHGYSFSLDCPKEAWILGDSPKLEQVIYNFISNAVNYTGEDKRIFIRVKKMKKSYRVEVEDFGPGIREDALEQIWNRYYRASEHHTRVCVGTGLGLSIVKNILELHHFPYGVESKFGEGSTFYFEAPILH